LKKATHSYSFLLIFPHCYLLLLIFVSAKFEKSIRQKPCAFNIGCLENRDHTPEDAEMDE